MTILTVVLVLVGLRIAFRIWSQRERTVEGRLKLQDGDSLTIGEMRCRMAGIDAPEWNSSGGLAARKALYRLIDDYGPVTYRVRGRDKFGRRLVTLYGADGADLNKMMVAEGHARAYARYSWAYLAAECRAKDAGLGNWRSGDFVAPELVRHPKG